MNYIILKCVIACTLNLGDRKCRELVVTVVAKPDFVPADARVGHSGDSEKSPALQMGNYVTQPANWGAQVVMLQCLKPVLKPKCG